MRLINISVVSSILLLREGGVPVGGGGRKIHKSFIFNIVYPPTTPAINKAIVLQCRRL